MSFKFALLLALCFAVSSIAFTGMRTSRIVSSKVSMAIPPFNWPGSKIPPSPLETLFSQPIGGGSSSSAPVKKSAPAPVKKSAPAPAAKKSVSLFSSKPAAAKSAAPSKAAAKAPAKTAAAPAPAKGKIDFTWGGRPDPTPEAFVDEKADFWGFAKSLGKKK